MKLIISLTLLMFTSSSYAGFYCQSDEDCGPWAHCYEGGNCIDDVQNGFGGTGGLFSCHALTIHQCNELCRVRQNACRNSLAPFVTCTMKHLRGGGSMAMTAIKCQH